MRAFASLGCGILFGLGLWLSGMAIPAKVLSFLDVFGQWDPSLVFVLFTAVTVAAIGYRLVFARTKPLFASAFNLPMSRTIDARLIAGAAIFGAGWGIGGYCPGPAWSGLALGGSGTWAFVAAMLAGMALVRVLERRPTKSASAKELAA